MFNPIYFIIKRLHNVGAFLSIFTLSEFNPEVLSTGVPTLVT